MLFVCKKGLRGLRNNPREGGAWSQGETCWRSAEWARRGSGLGDMGSSSPRGATRQGGAQRLLAESWRPGGTGTAEAAPRQP